MSPHLATAAVTFLILGLFWLERDHNTQTSRVLWIPVVWFWIVCSRPVSQWLIAFGLPQFGSTIDSADQMVDGSPLDRNIFLALLILGLIILFIRQQSIRDVLSSNKWLAIFFLYCALSIIWSDFPAVAFKRWIKAIGDVAMILVILSERDRLAAIKATLSRVAFLMIPLSVLYIKYYPDIGRYFNQWTWLPSYGGVATTKNMLGLISLVLTLYSEWRLFVAFQERKNRWRTVLSHGVICLMGIWLFMIADSATSKSCFALGSVIMIAAGFRRFSRKSWHIHAAASGAVLLAYSALFLGANGLVEDLGRDPTLTGRTELWNVVLGFSGNPFVGTGFGSFWLGPRLAKIWALYWWHPNQAHNGYLETYLNLGLFGIVVLSIFVLTGYSSAVRLAVRQREASILLLAYCVVAIIYNMSEAAFKENNPMWIFLLLAIMAARAMRASLNSGKDRRKDSGLLEAKPAITEDLLRNSSADISDQAWAIPGCR